MHVVHIIDNLQLVGGAQQVQVLFTRAVQATDLQQTFASLQEDGNSPLPDKLRALGARVISFPGPHLYDPVRFLRVVSFLRSEQVDLIHTHLTHANIIGTVAGRLVGVPVVASIYNTIINKRRYHTIRFGMETLILRYLANRVMAVGHLTADANRERLKMKRIEGIPTAVEIPPPISEEDRRAIRTELIGDPTRPIIISVGRLVPQKGYHHLLAAFQVLHERCPTAALVIAGSGKLYEELSNQITALGLQGHARLLGPRTDVPRLLTASDLFVSSSLWEGLPSALLEAMAAGLPVVVTRVGDISNVVVDGSGVIVPAGQPNQLAEAMELMLSDPSRMLTSGTAARNYVMHHHDPSVWSQKILNLYSEVLEHRPGHAQYEV